MLYGIVIGLIAGYIASLVQKGRGSGCFMNLLIGVVGGFLGGWIFSLFNITTGSWIGEIIVSTVGACVFLWLLKLIK